MAQQIEGVELQAVVHLRVSQEELRKRLRARAQREGRLDDTELALAHRFKVFDVDAAPARLLCQTRILVEINGEQSVQDVFSDITAAIDAIRAGRN